MRSQVWKMGHEVILEGLESGYKGVGLLSFAGWWRRTVAIEIGPFERGSG